MNAALLEHQRLFANLHSIQDEVERGLQILRKCIEDGNKILLCGNGGSAADCQHFAAELVGKWKVSQNRSAEDRLGLASGLAAGEHADMAALVAAAPKPGA